MKITRFEFHDPNPGGWSLSELCLHEGLNLFVGASGAGKTRVLNMLFNISSFVASDTRFCNGEWKLSFEHLGKQYVWSYRGIFDESRNPKVLSEKLEVAGEDEQHEELFSRSETEFKYKGKDVPKLSRRSSAIFLLREEDEMAPAHEAFTRVLRREFSGDALAKAAVTLMPLPANLVAQLEKMPGVKAIQAPDLNLPVRLYLLEKYIPELWTQICTQFKLVFPFIEGMRVSKSAATEGWQIEELPAGEYPMLFLKERHSDQYVPLTEMSSGMQKVLLIITDVLTSDPSLLYIIDEYENSLGFNAIDFLPGFLLECGAGRQFIVTSHHPHLINAIPVGVWFVFHRRGTNISVKTGAELEERYGRSKQQKFTQLLNDPFFTEGVE